MTSCYIPGCSASPVVRFVYRDTMASKCTEERCVRCAQKLKSNQSLNIIEEIPLSDEWKTKETKRQKMARKRGTRPQAI